MTYYLLIVDDIANTYMTDCKCIWPDTLPDNMLFYHITEQIQGKLNNIEKQKFEDIIQEMHDSISNNKNWKEKDEFAFPIGSCKGYGAMAMYELPTYLIKKRLEEDSKSKFIILLDLKNDLRLQNVNKEFLFKELKISGIHDPEKLFKNGGPRTNSAEMEKYLPSLAFLAKNADYIKNKTINIVITSTIWHDTNRNIDLNLTDKILAEIKKIINDSVDYLPPTFNLYFDEEKNIKAICEKIQRKKGIESLDWKEWQDLKRQPEDGHSPYHPHHLPGAGENMDGDPGNFSRLLYQELTKKQKKLLSICGYHNEQFLITDIEPKNEKWKPSARALLQIDFLQFENSNDVKDLTWVIEKWVKEYNQLEDKKRSYNKIFAKHSIPKQFDFLWFNCPKFLKNLEAFTKRKSYKEYTIEFKHLEIQKDDQVIPKGILVNLVSSDIVKDMEKQNEKNYDKNFPCSSDGKLSITMLDILLEFASTGVSMIVHSGNVSEKQNLQRSYTVLFNKGPNKGRVCNQVLPWERKNYIVLQSKESILRGNLHFLLLGELIDDPYKQDPFKPCFRVADPTDNSCQISLLDILKVKQKTGE